MRSAHRTFELTEKIFSKSFSVIVNALEGNKHLTRDELMDLLKRKRTSVNEYRSLHIMLMAEIEGIVCSGSLRGNKQTYTLLNERVLKKKNFNKEESLAELAFRYFSSHCPATLQDFAWWSGLTAADAKNALELVKNKFVPETIGTKTYWFSDCFSFPKNERKFFLLPAYDEFLISYKDRSASLPVLHNKTIISNNGIFFPTMVLNGQVVGLWKRTIKKDGLFIETRFFSPVKRTVKKLVDEAAVKLAMFLNTKPESIRYT